jgi:cellulose synthase/poly-beta-1,6-N-acetylglucosamine synthase-like glycosyltransferase
MRIVALLPAHNEAALIQDAVSSLRSQVHRVIVVCDNCSDDTEALARAAGAETFATVDNSALKAGALNQALRHLDDDWDAVLVMDADSVISHDFVETATRVLETEPEVGAVGGVFRGLPPRKFVEWLQDNEYARYGRTIAQNDRKVRVLTGTASVLRRAAVEQLQASRGFVYNPNAITEDNELTLALKTLGWRLRSPYACEVRTELMPTFGLLRKQRLRWYQGALENLRQYGWTPVTVSYWRQQLGLLFSTLALALYVLLLLWSAVIGQLHFSPLWTGVGAGFMIERLVTVWRAGWRSRLVAALVIPELVYDLFLQSVFLQAAAKWVLRKAPKWNSHVEVQCV